MCDVSNLGLIPDGESGCLSRVIKTVVEINEEMTLNTERVRIKPRNAIQHAIVLASDR